MINKNEFVVFFVTDGQETIRIIKRQKLLEAIKDVEEEQKTLSIERLKEIIPVVELVFIDFDKSEQYFHYWYHNVTGNIAIESSNVWHKLKELCVPP